MKSLYSRFVFMTVGIMLLSSIIGFLLTNVYYQVKLKPYNSEKILKYAEEVKSLYEKQSEENQEAYLQSIAKLGYEIYIVDDQKNGKRIGNAFRKTTISDDTIRKVLNGETFNGVSTYPTRLFITGFFDNELINSVGVPLKHGDKQYALFIRPDIQNQFGEMRIFLAVLLGFIVLLSIIFIAIAAGYIVRPIRKFTNATQKIASGEYEIELDVKRKDEIGTLLSIAGALLSPSKGDIYIREQNITKLSEKEMTDIRLKKIGFIFQFANLVPYLNVKEQLLYIAKLKKENKQESEKRADHLLAAFGLGERKNHYPNQLSGGEKQRVAIARAFMNNPDLILADEPTASLDSKRAREVVEMMKREVKESQKAAIMITHDERMLDVCDRILTLRDGQLI